MRTRDGASDLCLVVVAREIASNGKQKAGGRLFLNSYEIVIVCHHYNRHRNAPGIGDSTLLFVTDLNLLAFCIALLNRDPRLFYLRQRINYDAGYEAIRTHSV